MFIGVLLLILYLSFSLLQDAPVESESPFRVVTYNVWVGFEDDSTGRKASVAEWLKKQNPSLVALQELNGFTEEDLSNFANQWNHPYAVILKENGYPTGLTSRTPITNVERKFDNFHHGYLYAETAGLAVAVLHLSPFRYAMRFEEAGAVLAHVEQRATDLPTLILGDFNSLSPYDSVYYAQQGLAGHMIPSDQQHSHVQNLNDGQIDYEVLRLFDASGFSDISAICGIQQDQAYSFPTDVFGPVNDSAKVRIDYILANDGLSARCKEAGIKYEPNYLSDHYPVVADFSWIP